MTGEEAFACWSNPTGPWSNWVKPALFTHKRQISGMPDRFLDDLPLAWAPPADSGTALVLDLPNDTALVMAGPLAKRGYQPVPVYNCCDGPSPALEVDSILTQLWTHAVTVGALTLNANTPPAFLLDARRKEPKKPAPGRFDNRWIVLPQDFPSASLLQSRGIHTALLVQTLRRQPQEDLAHAMLRWQEGGMKIMATDLTGPPEPITIQKPRRFKSAAWALLAMAGLVQSSVGGFGGFVPTPSSGGS